MDDDRPVRDSDSSYAYPQQKLVSKVATARRSPRPPTGRRRRCFAPMPHWGVAAQQGPSRRGSYADLPPRRSSGRIQDLTEQLLELATSKSAAARRPDPKRAS